MAGDLLTLLKYLHWYWGEMSGYSRGFKTSGKRHVQKSSYTYLETSYTNLYEKLYTYIKSKDDFPLQWIKKRGARSSTFWCSVSALLTIPTDML